MTLFGRCAGFVTALAIGVQSVCAYTANNDNKTITSDGSLSDTQAASNYVRDRHEDGWVLTIGVPGGSYSWATQLTLEVYNVFTVQGASPADRPSIATTFAGDCGINVFGQPDKLITFKDIKFTGFASVQNAFIRLYSGGEAFRFTNVFVKDASGANKFWLKTQGSTGGAGPFGLIDNSEIWIGAYFAQNADSPDYAYSHPWKKEPNAPNHWAGNPVTGKWGTRNAIFFEDNILRGGAVYPSGQSDSSMTDGDSGLKLVIRRNKIYNAGVSVHGRDSSSAAHACRAMPLCMEVYDNEFIVENGIVMTPSLVNIRGGTALVHHNHLTVLGTGRGANGVSFQLHCAVLDNPCTQEGCRRAEDCSICLTEKLNVTDDYPDLGQPGFPEPARVWRNTPTWFPWYGVQTGAEGFIQINREFYFSELDGAAHPDYTPFTYPHPLNTGKPNTVPDNNQPPSITGAAAQGQVLTAAPGRWSGWPEPTLSHQWVRCEEDLSPCTNISGATSLTYSQGAPDVGHKLAIDETATNSEGTNTVRSEYTEVVTAPGATNRITNGGFELRTGSLDDRGNSAQWTGWVRDGTGQWWQSTQLSKKSGQYALMLDDGGVGTSRVCQDFVPSDPGDEMSYSFWSKNNVNGAGAAVYIYDYTNANNLLLREADCFNDWCKTEGTFQVATSPQPCTAMVICFDGRYLATSAFWLDDVVVAPPPDEPEPPAPSQRRASAGFAL